MQFAQCTHVHQRAFLLDEVRKLEHSACKTKRRDDRSMQKVTIVTGLIAEACSGGVLHMGEA